MKVKMFWILLILMLALPLAVAADSTVTVEVTSGVRSVIAPTAFACNGRIFSWSEQSGTCVGSGGAGAAGNKYEIEDSTFDGLGSHLVISGVSGFVGGNPANTFSIYTLAIMINPANQVAAITASYMSTGVPAGKLKLNSISASQTPRPSPIAAPSGETPAVVISDQVGPSNPAVTVGGASSSGPVI